MLPGFLALVLCPLFLTTGCTRRDTPAQLTIAAGPPGSAHEACGRTIATIVGGPREPAITAGPVESLQALAAGRADLALVPVDTLAQAVNGEAAFDGKTVSARAIATLYTSRLHLIVLDSSPIRGFSQLRNHAVGLVLPGSGTELTARRALAAALLDDKVTTRPVASLDDAAPLTAGQVDAMFWLDGAPSPLFARLVGRQQKRLRLLNNASVVSILQSKHGATLYEPSVIPAGEYGLTERTDTVGVPTALVSRHDLPQEVGYEVTRSLFANMAQLLAGCPAALGIDEKLAARSTPAALHSGAARYYRDAGISPR